MAACACGTASTTQVTDLFPCFYGGGGSCAFDREKFLELGGFDPLLEPFYLEDTDLGYMAWKRGWKVLYQPRSVVYHEHRGTIGKKFRRRLHPGGAEEELHAVLLEEHPRVAAAGVALLLHVGGRAAGRDVRRRPAAAESRRAVAGVPAACRRRVRSRWRARSAGRGQRHRGVPAAARRLLPRPLRPRSRPRPSGCACCSSRPIRSVRRCTAAACSCTRRCASWRSWRRFTSSNCSTGRAQERDNQELRDVLRLGRVAGAAERASRTGWRRSLPHAVREFANGDLEWLIHRQIYLQRIDVRAARVHAAGAVRAASIRQHRQRAVRARRLLPIDRPRPGTHDRRARRDARRASNTCARCATSCGVLPAIRPGAGLHAGESRVSAVVSARTARRACGPGLRAGIDTVAVRVPIRAAASP